jgi:hypothetical protein
MASPLRRALPVLLLALSAAPAAAGFRLEKQLALAPGGELVVDAAGGRVVVTGSAADGATVLITAERDDVEDQYTFDFQAEPGRVKVTSKRRRAGSWFSWLGWYGGGSLRYEIRVPRQTGVEVSSSGGGIEVADLAGEARLRSSGGRIEATDIAGDVDAESSGGGIEIERVTGDVEASSSGGGVVVAEVGGDVDASSSGGSVRLAGVRGQVNAESSGGSVAAVLSDDHVAGGRLSSSGGGVHVELAENARLSIDASSSGGSVSCDLPVARSGRSSRSSLRGDLNGGGPSLVLRSSGGGISIR